MDALIELWQEIGRLAHTRAASWQTGIFLSGLLGSVLLAQWLKRRFPAATSTHPLRASAIVLPPLAFWAWLLIGSTVLRYRAHIAPEILHYALLLVGAFTLIRAAVFVLRLSFSPSGKLQRWEDTLAFTIWAIVALHILGLSPEIAAALDEHAVVFGKVRVSVLTVMSFGLSIAVSVLIALGLANVIRARLHRSETLTISMKLALTKVSKFLLLVVAVLSAVALAGIDLTALTVFGGALGVGLGLGLQRVVSNFVSGFIVVFEESIRPGDVVSVGQTTGVVRALEARYIVVRTPDGLDVLVPNEELITAQIVNWSYEDDRNVRVRVSAQIGISASPGEALALLLRTAEDHARILATPKPEAYIAGFNDLGTVLELAVWVSDPERSLAQVRSDLYRRIWQAFNDAGMPLLPLKPIGPEAGAKAGGR